MTKHNTTQHNELTRSVYHKQHQRLNDDLVAYNRLRRMNTEDFFALGQGWFHGKTVLDAGCGNTVMLSMQLAEFGSKKVYAFDLGEEWIPDAENEIHKYGMEDAIALSSGDVLDISFPDEMFDFVACNGVLCHLYDKDSVVKAFGQLARVCKSGGELYVSFAIGKDSGLLEGAIFPAIREYYRKNEQFKCFIDNINPNDFKMLCDKISDDMLKFSGKAEPFYNSELFDIDLCVTIQNIIQAPTRIGTLFSLSELEELFTINGFQNIRRLNRYVQRSNIRKYLAPLHYDKQSEFSRILYGDGYIELIGTKQ